MLNIAAEGAHWDFAVSGKQQAAVEGGDGSASVKLSRKDVALEEAAARTTSNPDTDPLLTLSSDRPVRRDDGMPIQETGYEIRSP